MNKKSTKDKKSAYLGANETIAQNRRARFDYELLETFEAGLSLTGTEVKAMRLGRASIKESFATENNGTIVLVNMHVEEYPQAGKHLQHDPRRTRQLLLHKREINNITGAIRKEGLTLVPTRLYFNKNGIAKIELALARGKKQSDKRQTEKNRDWQRQKGRLMREKG